MLHPCCGLISLRNAVKISALVDLGLSITFLKIALFALILIIPIKLRTQGDIQLGEEIITTNDFLVIGIGFGLTLISSCLAVFLFFAAGKRNTKHCKIWMGSIVGLLIADILTWPLLSQIHISDIFIFVGIYAFSFYQFWIVYEFIKEVHIEQKNKNNHALVCVSFGEGGTTTTTALSYL